MLVTLLAAGIGLCLITFGAIGMRSAREIVRTQDEKGMSSFADGTVPVETRIRLTKYMAIIVVLLGIAAVVYATGRIR